MSSGIDCAHVFAEENLNKGEHVLLLMLSLFLMLCFTKVAGPAGPQPFETCAGSRQGYKNTPCRKKTTVRLNIVHVQKGGEANAMLKGG